MRKRLAEDITNRPVAPAGPVGPAGPAGPATVLSAPAGPEIEQKETRFGMSKSVIERIANRPVAPVGPVVMLVICGVVCLRMSGKMHVV